MEKLSITLLKSLFDQMSLSDQNAFRDLVYQPTEINLECDANILCEYIYNSFEIDHFEYQGQRYYEIQNIWSVDAQDQKFVCNNDDVCNIHSTSCENDGVDNDEGCQCFQKIYPQFEDVTYVLKYKQYLDELEPEQEEFYNLLDNHGANIRIVRKRDNVSHESIRVYNMSGENFDHQGSTHCQLDVGMEENIELALPCSLLELAEALFRIKSHKWDKWYEMYGHAHVQDGTLFVSFDHGS